MYRYIPVVNENLISLDLGYNEIKDNGAYALAQAIKNNSNGSIQSISVNNNYITKFGEVALTAGRCTLTPARDPFLTVV